MSRPGGKRGRASAVVTVSLVLVMAGLAVAMFGGVVGAAVTAGSATVVNAAGQPVLSGGSATEFGLSPVSQGGGQGQGSDVFCANYSSSSPQQLDSYLVPKGTDPSSVTFNPYPSTGGGLFESTGYYGNLSTNISTGQLPTLPSDFEWAFVVSTGTVSLSQLLTSGSTPGVWEAGLACVDTQGQVTTLWNVEVTFAANSSDSGGFTWTVPAQTTTTTTTTAATTPAGGGPGSSPSGGSPSSAPSQGAGTAAGSASPGGAVGAGGSGSAGGSTGFGPDDQTSEAGGVGSATGAVPAGHGSQTAGSGSPTVVPGSDAPVKDPSLVHDALTAAGLSSSRGVAIDLLVAGLLLMLVGWLRRRRMRLQPAAVPDGTSPPPALDGEATGRPGQGGGSEELL